jgi:hypothetical protein
MKHILLYGDSVFLTGLARQLGTLPEVTARQQASDSGPLYLCGLDAVIVDFDAVDTISVLDILRARPDLKIVGINPNSGAVTVLTGQVYLARSLADVVGCLEG